jgi:Transposase IS66 family
MLARRRKELAESTRRTYQRRLDRDLNAIMVPAPTNRHGKRLRKRYGKVRGHLFTFLEYPDVPPDNNGGERELRPTATYRRSLPPRTRGSPAASDRTGVPTCSPPSDLSSALRRDAASNAHQAILAILRGGSVLQAG